MKNHEKYISFSHLIILQLFIILLFSSRQSQTGEVVRGEEVREDRGGVGEGEALQDQIGSGGRVGKAGPEREWGRGRHDRNRRRSGEE
jgi:hypothetical protein